MDILKNVMGLFSANLHGDIKQHGAWDFFFRQLLREKKKELGQQETLLEKMVAARKLIQQEHEKCSRVCDELEENLVLAVEKHRTRIIINQLSSMLNHCDDLRHHIKSLDWVIKTFEYSLESQRLQYDQLKNKAMLYFYSTDHGQWYNTVSGSVQQTTQNIP
jgi:phage shock protein A